MVDSIRKADQSILLLDCGAVFDSIRDKAKLHLQAMELMGYDALNLGSPEFFLGREFLEQTRSSVSFPYIASNLLYSGSRLPWTREYIIKEVGGIRVAILGILDPESLAKLPNQEQVKGLEVIPPEAALKKLLPEVRGKADLVVLLSLFDAQKTRALVKATQGVDVAISSGSDDVFYVEPLENTALLQTGSLGKTLGSIKITLDEKRKLSIGDRQHVPLRSSVPGDEMVERLVEEFRKIEKAKAADLAKKEWDKRHKELTEGLQLSPQEFMERYRKEQIEKGKGESR